MQHKIYAIRDAKAEVYGSPWYKKTHGEAERDFSTLVNDPKSTVNQYPDDFDLYYVGEYNDESGAFQTLPTPQHIVKAVQVKRAGPN